MDRIQVMGDNVRYGECNDAAARLRALIPTIDAELPATKRLTETT